MFFSWKFLRKVTFFKASLDAHGKQRVNPGPRTQRTPLNDSHCDDSYASLITHPGPQRGQNCPPQLLLPQRQAGSTYRSCPRRPGQGVPLFSRERGEGEPGRESLAGSRPRGGREGRVCPRRKCLPHALCGGAGSFAPAHKPGRHHRRLGPHRGVLLGLKEPCVLSLPGPWPHLLPAAKTHRARARHGPPGTPHTGNTQGPAPVGAMPARGPQASLAGVLGLCLCLCLRLFGFGERSGRQDYAPAKKGASARDSPGRRPCFLLPVFARTFPERPS